MQVESKRVRVLPDGKRLVDLTVTRSKEKQRELEEERRLVVPEFDDDDSSSSSSEEEEEQEEREERENAGNNDAVFQGDFQWNGVQDIQQLTHENARLQSQVQDLHGQLKTYVAVCCAGHSLRTSSP
ncbi:hypothetical protein PINS_up011321 [Pythium insidiosum]|nr:hypothetical protein PINS_up011321 [Pythium insidiosum]